MKLIYALKSHWINAIELLGQSSETVIFIPKLDTGTLALDGVPEGMTKLYTFHSNRFRTVLPCLLWAIINCQRQLWSVWV